MKAKENSTQLLNEILYFEMIAINQYFLHARMYRNWGLGELNEKVYKASIMAMKHADNLINRILFLEGLPNLQNLGSLRVGSETEEMLGCDLELCHDERNKVADAIAELEKSSDFVSRELLENIQEHLEEHIDWIEIQQGLIEKTGIQNYLQSQMDDD